jgi:hypothetical protein
MNGAFLVSTSGKEHEIMVGTAAGVVKLQNLFSKYCDVNLHICIST